MNSLEKRYPVAASLAAGERDRKLLHGPVRPRWSVDGRHFWYATRDTSGTVHVLVDVAARRKLSLFDAVALAKALSTASSIEVQPGALPIDRIDVLDNVVGTSRRVSFVALGDRWRWDDGARRLERLGTAFAAHELASPDGKRAAFIDGANLRVRPIDEPNGVALTDDGETDFGWGDFIDYTTMVQRRVAGIQAKPHALWSPDSKRLAVLRVDRRPVKTLHLVQSVPSEGVRPAAFGYRFPMVPDGLAERERVELWVLGVDGSRIRVALDGLESFMHRAFIQGQGRWSSDGRWFDVVDNDRLHRSITLWRVDTRDGSVRHLFQDEGRGIVRAAPTLSMTPLYHVLADDRLIAWSQRDGWGHLYLLIEGQSAKPITFGDWQVRTLLHVDEVGERVMFTAGGMEPGIDPYFYFAYSIAFDGTDLRRLSPDIGDHEFLESAYIGNGELDRTQSVSPDGRVFIDVWSTVRQTPRSVLREVETGAVLMELEVGEALGVWPLTLPQPEPFSIAALEGGLPLWGMLYKPLDFDPEKRYPVVEVIYAAPQMTVVPKGWSPSLHGTIAEQLASVGFVAFIIDGPGTPFRSHEFQLASYMRMEICGNLPDHINALRQLAGTRPWMDLDKVGIVGGSGGGFATVRAMATYPEFFKVGVALCGSHDSTAYIPYWGEMFQGPYDKVVYERQDNNLVAKDIEGELLLVQGEMDDNVHPATTLRLVDSLIQADRDFELLIVPNAGHMLPFIPYVVRRVLDFFVSKLSRSEISTQQM